MTALRLGTRGSQLALWQAHAVASAIRQAGGPPCEVIVIKTSGDRLTESALGDVGGKRLFVKEIEDALARGEIDLAVHSAKDMPAVLPDGLAIGAVLPREDPRDVVVLPAGRGPIAGRPAVPAVPAVKDVAGDLGLHPSPIAHRRSPFSSRQDVRDPADLARLLTGAPRIGTSSVRRVAQIARLVPGARFEPIRGNLETRLRKLDAGDYEAIVLAAAGIRRLGLADRISFTLPISACVPAPGQGAIAVEVRGDDSRTRLDVAPIGDARAEAAIEAERALVAALGGGCQMPLGAVALLERDELELHALVISLDGTRTIGADDRGAIADAEGLGQRVAGRLLDRGAREILDQAARAVGAVQDLQP